MVDQLQVLHIKGEWLTVLDAMGILSLSRVAARRWLLKYVPREFKKKRGNRRMVHVDGLRAGLEKCVWRPLQPKGYQGVPGKLPVNVNCRDAKGRFVSHRPPGAPPRPPRRGWHSPRRKRYLSGGGDES